MDDKNKTKDQLIDELAVLRNKVSQLESTEAKLSKIQEELQEGQNVLQRISAAAPVGIVYTQGGRILWSNRAWEEMFGFSTDRSYVHKPTSMMYSSTAEYQQARSMLYDNIDSVGMSETTAVLIRSDGSVFNAHIRMSLLDRIDPMKGTISAISDISRGTETEQRLLLEKRRFEVFADNLPFAMMIVGPDGKVTYQNPKFKEVFGYELTEVPTGRDWFRKAFPDPRYRHDAIAVWLEDLAQTHSGETKPRTFVVTCKDGNNKTILFRTVRLDSGDHLVICENITERNAMEKSLSESEQKYRTLVDNAPIGILVSDIRGQILDVNHACLQVLGSPGAESTKSINMLTFPPLTEAGISEAVSTCMTEARLIRHECPYTSKWAKKSYLRMIIAPMLSGEGSVWGCQAVIEDITERKNLEAQLLQSQKMKALGTLAAGIAHDFNNMLQGILGYAELLLLDKKKGEPGYDELQRIIKTSEDARDLVHKIRVYSRRADIQPVPLDLNNSIRGIENQLRQTLPGTIDIETHLTKNLATVNADPRLMNQMVMNLSANAAEAMSGGGMLTIETQNILLDKDFCQRHPSLEPGLHVLLTISDTGRGIAPEHLDRLFDPFYSTKMRDYHKGTGLGLPFVQGIVELHKGFIDLSSEVGKGTKVRIYLPVLKTAQTQKAEEEFPVAPRGTETILLVEDEEMVRNLYRHTLEQFGYKVIGVTDGQEAVEVYEKEKDAIALVILDIIMPRMDGRQCLQDLLKLNPGAKVLVSSGVVEEDVIKNVVSLGAKDSLLKPFSLGDLLRKVREVLDAS